MRPNERRNDNRRNATRPQGSGDTGHHLPGAEPYPAPRIRGRWAPGPNNPLAPHTRTGSRAPQQACNLKLHPARPRTVHGQQLARRQQHRRTRGPARTMAHLTGRQRAQHTRRPKAPPRRHTPLPRPTPPPPGPPTPCAPTPTTPPRAWTPRLRQRPALRTYRPRHTPDRRPSDTTPPGPGRGRGQQNCHLPVAQPPARTRARTRHAPPPRRAPRRPRAREADPSRRPWRKATPEWQRNRRTMRPSRLHCQPNRSAGGPRWSRRKCGDPHNGQQRQHQWGNLAGEWTGRQHSVPTHRTWRHTEAGEALTTGHPDTESEGPMPNTECEDGLHPPSATGRAGAAPLANLARHADASTPGEAPPRDPPEARAMSGAREATPDTPQRAAGRETSPGGHNRDDDSFDAFMESCMGDPHMVPTPAAPRIHPEPRRDHAEDTAHDTTPGTPSSRLHRPGAGYRCG